MDYSKSRCPICLNRFCCVEHKDQHIKKNHPEALKSHSQEYLLKKFQRRAERIITNAQKYKAHIKRIEELTIQNTVNANTNKNRHAIKRPHSEINQQVVSRSIIIKSETRKILVPAYRAKGKTSSYKMEPKANTYIEVRKSSPCDVTIVKTSTPIIDTHFKEGTPHNTWNISQTSSICSYHTPSAFDGYRNTPMSIYETPSNSESHPLKSEELVLVNSQVNWAKTTLTSPRSIMSKISRYDNETGPSPNPNTAKCRRVTFSFGSSNSSPLESVQEVEVCNMIEDDVLETGAEKEKYIETSNHSKEYIEEVNKFTEGLFQEDKKAVCSQPSKVTNNLDKDLSPESTKSGFLNCVTNMICSAVPIFASWRESQNDQVNRAKRVRSPDTECVPSPEHKRLCYPFDLRLNPIKARKPISEK